MFVCFPWIFSTELFILFIKTESVFVWKIIVDWSLISIARLWGQSFKNRQFVKNVIVFYELKLFALTKNNDEDFQHGWTNAVG